MTVAEKLPAVASRRGWPGAGPAWRAALRVGKTHAFRLAILYFMPKSMFPEVEGNQILLRVDMPMGTSLAKTNEACLRMEDSLKEWPEIEHLSVTVGSLPQEGLQPLGAHQAQLVLDLSRRRSLSTRELVQLLKESLNALNLGGRIYVFEQGGTFSFLGGQGAPVVIEIKGYDLPKLESAARKVGYARSSSASLVPSRRACSNIPSLTHATPRSTCARECFGSSRMASLRSSIARFR